MTAFLLRIAGISALFALPFILGYEVIGPSVLTGGDAPSGSADAGRIAAYYAHPGLDPLALVEFMTIPLAGLFLFGLGTLLWREPTARPWVVVAGAAFVAEVPLIILNAALQAGLATSGGASVALFRAWDVAWNSGAYLLEASYVLAFAFASRSVATFPKGLRALGYVTGCALAFDVLALWLPIPEQASLPANLLFTAWFISNGVHLIRRSSHEPSAAAERRPAFP